MGKYLDLTRKFEAQRQPARSPTPQQPGKRAFLTRPLGHEEHSDGWDAWEPLMGWLLAHHPEHYRAICQAEDAISALEQAGMTQGAAYAIACETLRQRFATACKLAPKGRQLAFITVQ